VTNSKAFPVAHLDSVDAVMRLVGRLLTVVGAEADHVDVRILTDSHEAGRHCSVFPGAVLFAELSVEVARRVSDEVLVQPGADDSIIPWGDHFGLVTQATPGLLETLRASPAAPTEVTADELPADRVNVSVLAAIGAARTSIVWHLPGWPPIEELSLPGQTKHASIQATLNSSDIDELTPARGHLVYLHVGPWPDEQARASWLAQRVGCEILGPPEHGW
jgi:hypothetical protein